MSSGFISEAELAEQRKLRQEEWEKVRSADQPLERPEEPFDSRSLFERLQEQNNKRQAEYEEAHKLKNMIKGLDDDEVEFLDLVDRTKLEEERKKHIEEEKEMRDFKAAVATLQEKSLDQRLKLELKKPQINNKNNSSGSGRNSQLKLLAGVVVKKPEKTKSIEVNKGQKRKLSTEVAAAEEKNSEDYKSEKSKSSESTSSDKDTESNSSSVAKKRPHSPAIQTTGLQCIGILPGLGSYYDDSTDSDCSSDTDLDPEIINSSFDLLGRKIKSKDKEKS